MQAANTSAEVDLARHVVIFGWLIFHENAESGCDFVARSSESSARVNRDGAAGIILHTASPPL